MRPSLQHSVRSCGAPTTRDVAAASLPPSAAALRAQQTHGLGVDVLRALLLARRLRGGQEQHLLGVAAGLRDIEMGKVRSGRTVRAGAYQWNERGLVLRFSATARPFCIHTHVDGCFSSTRMMSMSSHTMSVSSADCGIGAPRGRRRETKAHDEWRHGSAAPLDYMQLRRTLARQQLGRPQSLVHGVLSQQWLLPMRLPSSCRCRCNSLISSHSCLPAPAPQTCP